MRDFNPLGVNKSKRKSNEETLPNSDFNIYIKLNGEKETFIKMKDFIYLIENNENLSNVNVGLVCFDYLAVRNDELSITKGHFVIIIKTAEDGWFYGIFDKQRGWFPGNFVLLLLNSVQCVKQEDIMASNQNKIQLNFVGKIDDERKMFQNKGHLVIRKSATVINRKENSKNSMVESILFQTNDQDLNIINSLNRVYVWYHGCISRDKAEAALLEFGSYGHFLIRSRKKKNLFAIAVKGHNEIKHFSIERIDEKFICGNQEKQSLSEIVTSFRGKIIGFDKDGNNILFMKPFPRIFY